MTKDAFIKEAVKEFNDNVRYDEAETGCNWAQDALEFWLTHKLEEAWDMGYKEVGFGLWEDGYKLGMKDEAEFRLKFLKRLKDSKPE